MRYATRIGTESFCFDDLKQVMAMASPARSGDYLAGVGAATVQQRMAARHVLADTPLAQFLTEALVPYEDDNITRLAIDTHDAAAFAPVAHLTVGAFRDWLLSEAAVPRSAWAARQPTSVQAGCRQPGARRRRRARPPGAERGGG